MAQRVQRMLSHVGSSHQGASQTRGEAYMAQQAATALPGPAFLGLEDGALAWYCLNDIVMGGRSSSELRIAAAGGLQFSGSISTQGGGFASCRTQPAAGGAVAVPRGAKGVAVTIGGDLYSHSVKFTMGAVARPDASSIPSAGMRPDWARRWDAMPAAARDGMLRSLNWQHTLRVPAAAAASPGGTEQRFFLPWGGFTASIFGQRLPGLELDTSAGLSHVGFSVGVFNEDGQASASYTDGPFKVVVHGIEFVEA